MFPESHHPIWCLCKYQCVCDGYHISQLADEYGALNIVFGDRVDVKILKVDVKKRRISLHKIWEQKVLSNLKRTA